MAMKVSKGLESLVVALPRVGHMSFATAGDEDIAEWLGPSGRLLAAHWPRYCARTICNSGVT